MIYTFETKLDLTDEQKLDINCQTNDLKNKPNNKDKDAISGFIPWELSYTRKNNNKNSSTNSKHYNKTKAKTSNQRDYIIEDTVNQLVDIAVKYKVAMGIENLDFSQKKNNLTTSYSNKTYNNMISTLAYNKFAETLKRRAYLSNTNVYVVNPTYSSLGGFIKYGVINHVGFDTSASHWLGRQALYGEQYVKSSEPYKNVIYVKKYKEVIALPYLLNAGKQSKNCSGKLTWKAMALVFGSLRCNWHKKLYSYTETKIGQAPQSKYISANNTSYDYHKDPFTGQSYVEQVVLDRHESSVARVDS